MMDVMRKLVLSAVKSSHVLARTQGSRNMMAVRLMSVTKQVNMKFEEAADCVQTLKNEPGNDVKLKMYALFKQATIGANTTKKPGAFNFVGQAKWTAWKDLETISQEEAKAMYVKIVRDLMEAEGESVGHAEDVVAASEFKHIVVTEQDNFTKILLNRPNKKNALTVDMYEELIVALNSAGKSDKSALTVITGAGDYFCSGNDLGNFMSITPDKMHAVAKESGDLLRRYVAAYIDHPKPLVAAINGPAIGVAVTVLGLCDVVYAADHATFTTPFSQLGQSPEGCSSYTFPKIMGHSKACELMLFNVKLNASEALNCGLVTRVFPKHEFQTRLETALKQMSALPVKKRKNYKLWSVCETMAAKSEFVKVEKFEEYAMIRLDRPHRKNGIITEMYKSIGGHLKLFAEDPALKFVVLTGTGEYFTSGADLAAQRNNTVDEGLAAFKNFVDSLLRFPKPIVVAVNGPAIGIGVSCLPLCDVVYASDNSTFLTPFSRIGAAPEACSSVTFPKLMGYAKANEMLLFNRVLSAQEALQAGLVSDVFAKETFRSEVQKRIDEFVDNPALSLLYGKRLLREHELEQLLEVNAREVDRLRERFTSVDAALQAAKFVKRRSEINAARRRNTSKL